MQLADASLRRGFVRLVRARLEVLNLREEVLLTSIGEAPGWLTDFAGDSTGRDIDWVTAWNLLLALGFDPGRALEDLVRSSYEPQRRSKADGGRRPSRA